MRRYADVQWYTMIHGAVGCFRSQRSQPKLISWWRIFVVKLMVPVFRRLGNGHTHTQTHTHTLTLWEYTQTHTQKNTKRGSTMINNDQHSPPRATLAPYISSYLLVSPRISSYSLWSFCLNRFVLILEGQLCGTISTSADSATSIYLYHLESSWVNILLDLGYPSVSTNHGLLDCLSAKMIKNADSLKWKLQRINGRKSDWECDPAILLKQFSFT